MYLFMFTRLIWPADAPKSSLISKYFITSSKNCLIFKNSDYFTFSMNTYIIKLYNLIIQNSTFLKGQKSLLRLHDPI